MNWLDWVFLVIIGFSTVAAFWQGLARELIMLAATILAFGLGVWEYRRVGWHLRGWIHSPDLRDGAGFIIIFVGVLLLAALLSHLLRKLIQAAGLRWFDRLLGAALGMARGVLVCAVLLIALTAFPLAGHAVDNSRLSPDLLQISYWAAHALPAHLRGQFEAGWQQWHARWFNARSARSMNHLQ